MELIKADAGIANVDNTFDGLFNDKLFFEIPLYQESHGNNSMTDWYSFQYTDYTMYVLHFNPSKLAPEERWSVICLDKNGDIINTDKMSYETELKIRYLCLSSQEKK